MILAPKQWILILFYFFTFSLSASDYYWIGGTGNWSDISHWSTTSGGIVTHNQAPTANDNVFFDANSFTASGQIVTLNTDIIFCRNMTWSGATNNPIFTGGSNVTFNIFGSLTLIPAMTFTFSGRTIFSGSLVDNTIDFGTHQCGQDMTISGMGTWTLDGNIMLDSAFVFNEGTLNTNGRNIDCLYFNAETTNERTLNMGASTITIRGETIDPYNGVLPDEIIQPLFLNAENLTMNGGTSTFVLTNPIVDIWLEGPGIINFNNVVLNSPIGNSKIIPWAIAPTMNYNEIDLFHRTLLNGSPDIGNLILHPDQRYTFESGGTFSFGKIDAQGTCSSSIILEATSGGQATTFNTINNINLDFVSLKGIATTGTGSFSAVNAIDLGNNTGWTITPKAMQEFFWIGGTGKWNDGSHWALSSGGSPSGCIPTGIDDVYFDMNSFTATGQTVTINIENANCHNMSWENAANMPEFAGPIKNNMYITGSLTFINTMRHTFFGNYHFESSKMSNTITTAGKSFNYDLFFAGVDGEWILQDDMLVKHDIFYKSGTLRTNDQDINAHSFFSQLPFFRRFVLGNSYITIDNGEDGSSVWHLNAENLSFDAGLSTIETKGIYSNLIRSFGTGTIVYNKIIFNCPEGRFFSIVNTSSPAIKVDSLIFNQDAFIAGSNIVNYWHMAAGQSYTFRGDLQTITELDANGDCARGLTLLLPQWAGRTCPFDIANDHTFDRLYIEGIDQKGTGRLQAKNSLDGGDNTGWNITNLVERSLFWVGDSGNWDNPAHWSLSSGGTGGECIPTSIDDVTFDTNSFSSTHPYVDNSLGNDSSCKNMTWTADISNQVTFRVGYLYVYASLDIQADIEWANDPLYFKGDENHTINTVVPLNSIDFRCKGSYTLHSYLEASFIRLTSGTFNTNNYDILTNRIICDGIEANRKLILGNSYLTLIDGSSNIYNASINVHSKGLILDPGQSTIECTHQYGSIHSPYPLDFHNVIFSHPQSDALIISDNGTFNRIDFNGNGEIRGSLNTDTLNCSPGKAYIFDEKKTQTINNYWKIIGNNCTPISLYSSVIGSLATVNMPTNALVLSDFVNMRDINAMGGTNFLAGAHSTNINNSNRGWTFDSAPEFVDIGFLGEDKALCTNGYVTLNAYSYSLGETYLWQDGTTDSILVVNQSGTYAAQVTFGNNCIILDTINVISIQDFAVDLPDDADYCEGDILILNANAGINTASYLWQDGSTSDTLKVNDAGEYSVLVDIGGCVKGDTTTVSFISYPSIDLGEDFSACEGNTFNLEASEMAESYLWQDGAVSADFTGNTAGIYWLEAANGDCAVRDSVEVSYINATSVNLGADTLLCDQDNYLLELNIPDASYQWQDGSSSNSFASAISGEYWVNVTVQTCATADTIQLTFQDNPTIEIDDKILGCEGDVVEVNTSVIADRYNWSNGDTDANFSTTLSGLYSLDATFGQCNVREAFEVILNQFPMITSLGINDTICEGETLTLNAITDIGNIKWHDGSTSTSYAVDATGEYWFVADNNGCTSADTITVNIVEYPNIDLGDNLSPCEGKTFNLQTTESADTYLWQDGSTKTDFTGNSSGIYWLEAANGNCAVRDSLDVNYVNVASISLGTDTLLCDQDNYILELNTPNASYEWHDGSTSNSFASTTSGEYWVNVTVQTCATADTIQLTFQDNPTIRFDDKILGCEGDVIEVNTAVIADRYAWSDGDTDANFSTTLSGQYSLDATFGECNVREEFEVILNQIPMIISLGENDTICEGETLTLSAISDVGNIEWHDGSTATSYTANTAGEYWFVADNVGCASADTISVILLDAPTVALGEDKQACDGDSITLSQSTSGLFPLWEDGGNTLPRIVYTSGEYWLELEDEKGCIGRDTIAVSFSASPALNLGKDTTVCDNTPYIILPIASEGLLNWPDGSTQQTYVVDTPSEIIAVLDNNGCSSTDTISINFKECHFFEAFIPNVFSPKNDAFQPFFDSAIDILDYSMNIYNRWGERVFATTDPSKAWDATWKNATVATDVYVYSIDIHYRDDAGENQTILRGNVTVLE